MRVEFYQPADEHERYMPRAFDGLVGQSCPFKIAGVERGQATVIAVKVDEDGRGATWTVDIPDPPGGPLSPAARSGAFSFQPADDPLKDRDLFEDSAWRRAADAPRDS